MGCIESNRNDKWHECAEDLACCGFQCIQTTQLCEKCTIKFEGNAYCDKCIIDQIRGKKIKLTRKYRDEEEKKAINV